MITLKHNVIVCGNAQDPGLMLSLPKHLHRTNILHSLINEMMQLDELYNFIISIELAKYD